MRVTTGLSAGDEADIEFPEKGADPSPMGERTAPKRSARGLNMGRVTLPSAAAVWTGVKAEAAAALGFRLPD